MFKNLDEDEFIEIDEEYFRSIEFDNEEERKLQQEVIEKMDKLIALEANYQLIFHNPSATLYVLPEERTVH